MNVVLNRIRELEGIKPRKKAIPAPVTPVVEPVTPVVEPVTPAFIAAPVFPKPIDYFPIDYFDNMPPPIAPAISCTPVGRAYRRELELYSDGTYRRGINYEGINIKKSSKIYNNYSKIYKSNKYIYIKDDLEKFSYE